MSHFNNKNVLQILVIEDNAHQIERKRNNTGIAEGVNVV